MNNKLKIVEISNVSLDVEGKNILKDISIFIYKGDIITLIGPNGSGKTTLAKLLIGILKPTSGFIKLKKDLRIGYVPQKFNIDPYLPITVNGFLNLCNPNIKIINELIDDLKINKLLNYQLKDLSGGELQKIMLTRALSFKPELLVLDEPIQGIDIRGQEEFYSIIEEIKSKKNTAIFMISHDLHMVMKSSDHVICLNKHICCQGTITKISKEKNFQDLFNSNNFYNLALYKHDHKEDN